jgi:uncharacterized membrane protein YeaQ/YmgE (transglycosylase-associated protein family)
MSFEAILNIAGWIFTGAIAGYVASVLLKAERQGCLINIAIGVAGAFVGGFVMNLLLPGGLIPGWGWLNGIINAIVGAVILLVAIEIIVPGKQLGVDKGEEGGGRRRRRR